MIFAPASSNHAPGVDQLMPGLKVVYSVLDYFWPPCCFAYSTHHCTAPTLHTTVRRADRTVAYTTVTSHFSRRRPAGPAERATGTGPREARDGPHGGPVTPPSCAASVAHHPHPATKPYRDRTAGPAEAPSAAQAES